MKRLVGEVADEYGFKVEVESDYNLGALILNEKS
jgi:hypothetical protein